jgi:hypothetical protein
MAAYASFSAVCRLNLFLSLDYEAFSSVVFFILLMPVFTLCWPRLKWTTTFKNHKVNFALRDVKVISVLQLAEDFVFHGMSGI